MRASEGMQKRFNSLVEKSENEEISSQEKDELNHFVVIERLLRLAKIRAEYYSPSYGQGMPCPYEGGNKFPE